jgi:hypothetical protein
MITLRKAVHAWNTSAFESVLKEEIEALDGTLLPLQQGLTRTSYAITEGFSAIIINVTELDDVIRAKVGLSYRGIIPGCSCADDPTPIDEVPEYCVAQFDIDRKTAETTVTLLDAE